MVKVVICGAAGGIGQPLSLLLKQSNLISHLALYDVVNAPGVAADLSHINTKSKVTGHGKEHMDAALEGAHTVIIPAGVPRKPGMTRDDLFKINAGIVRDLATGVAKNCPEAYVLVISNPVNSTVPIVSEVLKKHGVYNPKKVFGVSTLDVVRASKFISEVNPSIDPSTRVTVVGGHSGNTIVPLLSQVPNFVDALSSEQLDALTNRIQFGGDEVVKAKDGAGSATLSMAYAGARFALTLLEATVNGQRGSVESTYVNLEADARLKAFQTKTGLDYFALDVEFGPEGVESILELPTVSAYEEKLLEVAIKELKDNISK
ncbi:hypothetical protein BGX34_001968, partial [Mortierella sp. NVP85]